MSQIKSAEPAAVSTFPRWIIPSLIALAIVGAAMAMAQPRRISLAVHPHLPDLDLLAAQPMVIKVHLAAALAAIGLGAVMMLARKGRLFHRLAGWTWVSLMAVAAGFR